MMVPARPERPAPHLFASLSRLGAAMADPFAFLHADHLPDLGGSPSALGHLAAHSSFGRALRRAMPDLAPLARLEWDMDWLDPEANPLLSLVLSLSPERLLDLCRDLAALALHARLQRVLSVVDRQALKQALGEAAWDLARHEASLAYPAFAGLDLPLAVTADLSRMERSDFERLGGALLLALTELENRAGLALATLRFPRETAAFSRKFTVTARQRALALRLLERRGYAP